MKNQKDKQTSDEDINTSTRQSGSRNTSQQGQQSNNNQGQQGQGSLKQGQQGSNQNTPQQGQEYEANGPNRQASKSRNRDSQTDVNDHVTPEDTRPTNRSFDNFNK